MDIEKLLCPSKVSFVTSPHSLGTRQMPSQGKAGSLGPHPSSAASALVSPLVQELPLPWVEEDPTINTVLPHPQWGGTLPSPRSKGWELSSFEKWALSSLFQKGRSSHLVCDEPWSKWPRARAEQGKTASPTSPPAPGVPSGTTPPGLCTCSTLCLEGSLYTPSWSFLSPNLMPTSGLSFYTPSPRKPSLAPWSGSSAPLLYSKCWLLATEFICSPVGLPHLTQPLQKRRPISGSQLQPQSPSWSRVHSRHQINVCWLKGPSSITYKTSLGDSVWSERSTSSLCVLELRHDLRLPAPSSLSASVSPDNLHSSFQIFHSPPTILFCHLDTWAYLSQGR